MELSVLVRPGLYYTPRPTQLVGGILDSPCPSVHPSSSASVDGMVSGHFLSCFCTNLLEMQNDNVIWVKEETYGGDFQNFQSYHFGRILTCPYIAHAHR